jgi:hypothetical protein
MDPISMGAGLDASMASAESLISSDSLQSQLQGQMQMQKVMQKYNAISTFIKNLSDMQKEAINNSKSNG